LSWHPERAIIKQNPIGGGPSDCVHGGVGVDDPSVGKQIEASASSGASFSR
jgi:hypothetical protein